MGGRGSKTDSSGAAPAGAPPGQLEAPPEAVALAAMPTQITPELAKMPADHAIQLAVGVLTERLYCADTASAFYECFARSGKDPYEASTGTCRKEHEGLMKCVEERQINDVAERFLGYFAMVKCPKEVEAAKVCMEKGRSDCQPQTEAAYSCAARHILALLAEDGPAEA
eukprot:EG_transcript_24648